MDGNITSLLELLGISGPLLTILLGVIAVGNLVNGYFTRQHERRQKGAQELQENIPKLQAHFAKHVASLQDPNSPPLGDAHTESDLIRLARRSSDLAVSFMRAEAGTPILRWFRRPVRYLAGADYASLAGVVAVLRDQATGPLFEHSISVGKDTMAKALNSRMYCTTLYSIVCIEEARKVAARSTAYVEQLIEEAKGETDDDVRLPLIGVKLPSQFNVFGRSVSLAENAAKTAILTPSYAHLQGVTHHARLAAFEIEAAHSEAHFAKHLAIAMTHMQQIEIPPHFLESLGNLHGLTFKALAFQLDRGAFDNEILSLEQNVQALPFDSPIRNYFLASLQEGDFQAAAQSDDDAVLMGYLNAVRTKLREFAAQAKAAQAPQGDASEQPSA